MSQNPMTKCGVAIIRQFAPGDTAGVNCLFKEAYGSSYPYKVSNSIPEGAYYFVAEDQITQAIIGFARSSWLTANHLADPYPNVHELGGYVVNKQYRRRGIGAQLSKLCEEAATTERGEIHILNSEPVTWENGLASQRIFEHHGFQVFGILPFKYPHISPEYHGQQPASMTLVAQRAKGIGFIRRPVFLPASYEGIVDQFMHSYEWADDSLADLAMPQVVNHAPVAVGERKGSEFVDIPANWPEARLVTLSYLKDGYHFSAFLPEHGELESLGQKQRFDYVRLYRPPVSTTPHDWDLIQVLPVAEHIKSLVVNESYH